MITPVLNTPHGIAPSGLLLFPVKGDLYKLLQLLDLSSSRHQMLKAQIAAAKSEHEEMVELDKDITPFVRA